MATKKEDLIDKIAGLGNEGSGQGGSNAHAEKREGLINKINSNLDGGYEGLLQETKRAVESDKRPTSALRLVDGMSDATKGTMERAQEKQKEQKSADAVKGQEQEHRISMDKLMEILSKRTLLNEAQQEMEDKRRKREAIFSAIGDGISSLSNLITASKGAPNVFNPQESLSEKSRKRWDELNKERESRLARYQNAALNMYKLQNESDKWKALKEYRMQELERQRKDAETRAKNAATRQREADSRQFKAETERDYKEATVKLKEIWLDIQKDLADGKINLMQAQARWSDAKAAHERVKAQNDQSGYTTTTNDTDDFGVPRTKTVIKTPNRPSGATEKRNNPMGGGKKQNPMS